MEDSEKLMALKKAYADIILNTAKEAAARIMVSERKAMRFQRELVSTKEEALRMLVRVKQMMDSKVSEAEMTSLSQQKKIDELEAQLQEAEEIVRDLRAELREVQSELEKVTVNQMNAPVEPNIEGEIAAQENILQGNRLNPYGFIDLVPDLQFKSFASYDARNSNINGTIESSKCYVSHDHINNCYIDNPDFASIVIRRKEPELSRNGCTQRIRAIERSLFDGNVSLNENADAVQNETSVRGDEEGKGMSLTTNAKPDIICEVEKPEELKVVNADSDLLKVPVQRKKRRLKSRKGLKDRRALQFRSHSYEVKETIKPGDTNAMTEQSGSQIDSIREEVLVEVPVHRIKNITKKRKPLQSKLHSDQVKEISKESYLSCTKSSPHVFDSNDLSKDNSSKVCENEAQKDLMSPSFDKETTGVTPMIEPSVSQNDTQKEAFLQACSAWNKIDEDKELLDKSDLTRQESLSAESFEVPACRTDNEAANESSDKLGPVGSDLDEKFSSKSVNDRFLKYTFRRKRKKESLSSADVDCSLENSSLKKNCGEKQIGHVEPPKSCTITESSRDSRRVAQVARQLISLSEKKRR